MTFIFATTFLGVFWQVVIILGIGLLVALLVAITGRKWLKKPTDSVSSTVPTNRETGSPKVERRAHPRQSVNYQQVFVYKANSESLLCEGLILNKSLGGLGLEVPTEIEVYSRLRLTLPTRDESTGMTVEVRYARKKGTVWRIGCQFPEHSHWDIMQWLGPPDPDE